MKRTFQHKRTPGINGRDLPFANALLLLTAATTAPILIKWLWYGWLAAGKFHILAGAPGTGKTTLAMCIIAAISNGGHNRFNWPDKSATPHGHVIIWSGEDGIEDTIIPRLIAAGANLNFIHIIHGIAEHDHSRSFNFDTDLSQLKQKVEEIGGVVLILIDSIVQAVSGDSNKNSDVRKALLPLIELGEEHSCAILGITHVNKNSKGKDPLDRVTGSLAFGAAARLVWFTTKVKSELDDGTPPSCILVRAKSNIEKDDGGFEYFIQSADFQYGSETFRCSNIRWNETALEGSNKELVKAAEGGGTFENIGAVEAAENFLKTNLANGPLPWSEIEARALLADVSKGSIKKAKAKLGVQHKKQSGVGQNGPSIWRLPAATTQPLLTRFGNCATPLDPINPTISLPVQSMFTAGQLFQNAVPVEPVEPVEPVPDWQLQADAAEAADAAQEPEAEPEPDWQFQADAAEAADALLPSPPDDDCDLVINQNTLIGMAAMPMHRKAMLGN